MDILAEQPLDGMDQLQMWQLIQIAIGQTNRLEVTALGKAERWAVREEVTRLLACCGEQSDQTRRGKYQWKSELLPLRTSVLLGILDVLDVAEGTERSLVKFVED